MKPPKLDLEALRPHLEAALREDIGTGDLTTNAIVPPDAVAAGRFVAREEGVLAGGVLLAPLFALLDERVEVEVLKADGESFMPGQTLARVHGPARAILSGERVALNFLQRLCGIATMTSRFVKRASAHGTRILDTRKTTPGWRALEKYAVAAIRSALAVDPNNKKFVSMLKGADYERAARVLDRYLRENPGDQGARFILAKLRVKLGDVLAARRELEEVSRKIPRISPLRKEVHIELGRIYEKENPQKAVLEYKRAEELGGVQMELLQKLLRTYRKEGNEEKFIETAEKLLNLDPQNAGLEYELGLIYEKRAETAHKLGDDKGYKRNVEKALKHLSNAAKIDNSNLRYNLKLAELLERQHNNI